MTKKAREWFMELPDGYRELALEQFPEDRLDIERNNMCHALIVYSWNLTESGHDFWRKVYQHYELPPLPLPPLPEKVTSGSN